MSGTPLAVALIARLARELANIAYFKDEVPRTAAKLRGLIALGGVTAGPPRSNATTIVRR